MNMSKRSRHKIALAMATVMTVTSLPLGSVQAGMISTEQLLQPTELEHKADELHQAPRERVKALLARDDVRAEMIALGVSQREAEARVAAMTDTELASLAGRLDQLPAGEGIGTVLIIVFVLFGVAVMLDALGMMNVFPFVCGPGECGAAPQQAYYPDQGYPQPQAGPPVEDPYARPERRSSYRRDQFDDPYSRRRDQRYESNQYYEPAPVPPSRNYYEERFGTQRYVR